MNVRQRVKRVAVAGSLDLAAASGGIATDTTVQASDSATDKISCSAIRAHKSASKGSTPIGIAYKGDKITYKEWVYRKPKKICGYGVCQCAK
ncbi:hypothetical protein [Streptomyces sp. PT19]|uniref:hypothetical protein n=1 Tax=Streptomyces sp. PT19 TaxID=3452239 RepID=UPI003F7ECD51